MKCKGCGRETTGEYCNECAAIREELKDKLPEKVLELFYFKPLRAVHEKKRQADAPESPLPSSLPSEDEWKECGYCHTTVRSYARICPVCGYHRFR